MFRLIRPQNHLMLIFMQNQRQGCAPTAGADNANFCHMLYLANLKLFFYMKSFAFRAIQQTFNIGAVHKKHRTGHQQIKHAEK